VRENEILLRKCSGGSAHLRTLEGTLVTRESARFDNNHSEPKSQVRQLTIFRSTYCQKQSVIFPMSEWERMFFAKRQLQTTKSKHTKINCKTTGGVQSQI